MSFGTNYIYDGYLSRITKDEVEEKRAECDRINDMIFREILAYMAMTPPAEAEDEEGNKYPWAEFIASKLHQYKEEIMDNYMLMARLDDCIETMKESPEKVTES